MNTLIPIGTAQAEANLDSFGRVINPIIGNIVYPIIALLFAIATLVFVYGVLQLVFRADDSDVRSEAKRSILYGVIGMFIMVSAWGIIYLVSNTLKGI